MTVLVHSAAYSEALRWREWKARGRADDLRFHRKLKTVVVGLAAVAALGATWFAFQF